MAGGKETPRQKMIGMMYLVLTALLAMNVSKSILDAFIIINEGLVETNEGFGKKNEKTYNDFAAALAKDPAKVQPYHALAQKAQKIAGDLVKYINDLKTELIIKTDNKEKVAADTLRKKMRGIDSKDNYDIPSEIMIGSDPANPKDGPFTAKELKKKINDARAGLLALFNDQKLFLPGDVKEMDGKLGMKTHDFGMVNGVNESWETGNFEHMPLAAVVTNLSKMEADVKNAEADVINKLLAAVKGKDFTFDKLVAKVIAPSSYILSGEEYKADVLLVAFNSTTSPKVIVGAIDTTKHDENVNPLTGTDTTMLPVQGGMGKYMVSTSAEGLQKWSGVIQVEKPGGGSNYYPFSSEYMVAKPAIAVSPTKMNVFYIGVDNPVDITAAGVAPENVKPSLSGNGSISGSKGKYTVRVNGGSECTINVSAQFGSQTKSMGPGLKFRVKRVPSPLASVANKTGDDVISKGELMSAAGIIPKLEDFVFDLKFPVVSFVMSMNVNGVFVDVSATGAGFSQQMKDLIQRAKPGTKVFFEQVKVTAPDGVRKIPGVTLKVK